MSRVLVIGDTHFPFVHPKYRRFLLNTYDRFECNRIVHIGDEFDNAALSRYDSDPDGLSAGDELKAARKVARIWYKTFPKVDVVESNHGVRPFKKAFGAGIPAAYLRSYREFTQAPPGWKWHPHLVIDGVLYFHGEPFGGPNAARSAMGQYRMSCVIGHVHSYAGVVYSQTRKDMLFGMNVGCGIDDTTYPFKYAKDQATRPTLGCGVVLEGKEALFIPMR